MAPKGKEFEDTYHRGKPAAFKLGSGHAFPGLEEGIKGMELGDEARLEITSDDAYGSKGFDGGFVPVPPNTDIVVEVALMQINQSMRKQPKDGADCCSKFMYTLTRGY